MGMFDSLKKAIKSFAGKAAEDAKVEDAPPTPPAAPPPAPSAPAKKPAKRTAEDDWDDELAAIEAEVTKEPPKVVAPTRPAPPAPPPDIKPSPPAPTPPKPAAPAAPTAKPAPPPSPPKPEPAKAAEARAGPSTFEVVERKPAPAAAPAAEAHTPAPRPAPPAPKAPAPSPKAPSDGAAKGRAIEIEKIDDLLWDLELSLLESDVALPVVEEIKETLKKRLPELRVSSPDEVPAAVEGALRDALLQALSVEPIDFDTWVLERTTAKKPVVIMFVGVNGTGKTTSIGRVAHRLKENGYTSVMAAGDTFRAGAIQQLERHAEKVGVSLIKTVAGGDPAAVAFDAIEHAKGRMKDVVLLDTAGRMQTNTNLMDEMKKIKRVAKPDMIIFVGDSLAGNDAVEQAVQFDKAVGIDAVILTKVDTDAKGGAALSIAKAVGKPILFLGVGQEYADMVPYDPNWMVERIFEAA